MFLDQINKEFADCMVDGNVVCEPNEFRIRLQNIVINVSDNQSRKNNISKRKPSNFVLFRKEKSDEIKNTYFADFDSWDDWSENGILQYYQEKKLTTDKLSKFIEKQKIKDKVSFKPKLAALISIRAGVMWKELNDSEKLVFTEKTGILNRDSNKPDETTQLNIENPLSDNVQHVEVSFEKKKGRPKGKQPVNSVSNTAILETFEEHSNIELEEFEFGDTIYYKDVDLVVYSMDDDENFNQVGTFINGCVNFS
jgi:hypothetical protein